MPEIEILEVQMKIVSTWSTIRKDSDCILIIFWYFRFLTALTILTIFNSFLKISKAPCPLWLTRWCMWDWFNNWLDGQWKTAIHHYEKMPFENQRYSRDWNYRGISEKGNFLLDENFSVVKARLKWFNSRIVTISARVKDRF